MIEIENLTKTFGTQTVISDVSGIFYPGKIYGFVGRNGSGKTVLMKMILGFIKPTSGTIKVNGKQVGKEIDIPDDIGAIIETPGFLPEYSAFQNLKLMAMIRGNSTSMKENTVPGSRAFAAHSSPKLIPPASAVPNQPSAAVSRISAAYTA